jgi:hypothetical protein
MDDAYSVVVADEAGNHYEVPWAVVQQHPMSSERLDELEGVLPSVEGHGIRAIGPTPPAIPPGTRGDEPGTLKGLASGTVMAKAEYKTYPFTVIIKK